eukprot:TRINITY_DN3457_c0_g1_i1.p1 TRINITY_DN3457_c0_g1~~TRINITY_DN3457_c0_g1_i1.p1  ORF type:complete len:586 (+),score=132.82 TRINITY_DN3457_c0_g1_i1:162-1760(+)
MNTDQFGLFAQTTSFQGTFDFLDLSVPQLHARIADLNGQIAQLKSSTKSREQISVLEYEKAILEQEIEDRQTAVDIYDTDGISDETFMLTGFSGLPSTYQPIDTPVDSATSAGKGTRAEESSIQLPPLHPARGVDASNALGFRSALKVEESVEEKEDGPLDAEAAYWAARQRVAKSSGKNANKRRKNLGSHSHSGYSHSQTQTGGPSQPQHQSTSTTTNSMFFTAEIKKQLQQSASKLVWESTSNDSHKRNKKRKTKRERQRGNSVEKPNSMGTQRRERSLSTGGSSTQPSRGRSEKPTPKGRRSRSASLKEKTRVKDSKPEKVTDQNEDQSQQIVNEKQTVKEDVQEQITEDHVVEHVVDHVVDHVVGQTIEDNLVQEQVVVQESSKHSDTQPDQPIDDQPIDQSQTLQESEVLVTTITTSPHPQTDEQPTEPTSTLDFPKLAPETSPRSQTSALNVLEALEQIDTTEESVELVSIVNINDDDDKCDDDDVPEDDGFILDNSFSRKESLGSDSWNGKFPPSLRLYPPPQFY